LAATTSDRPWSGALVSSGDEGSPEFDPTCYLCPGVTRASGITNPQYTKPYAFTNDFASFSMNAPDVHRNQIFEKVEPVHGTCRVICFSPKHNTTLAELNIEGKADVVKIWQDEFTTLSAHEKIDNVLIFENKGKCIGVSNPHPHGQIYATNFVPRIVQQQLESQLLYKKEHGTNLFDDLLKHEISKRDRIVMQNDHFVAFIPFFARFVYEVYIVPKRHVSTIIELTGDETKAFVEILHHMTVKFDNLYQMTFPNILMQQNAPTDGNIANKEFRFHIEFYPPLRAPDKLKYLAGFESGGGNIINPVLPEEAAGRLREAPLVHYKNK
jgi:UDPglucose--hexose-1-phosphate uridylyltransferase